MTNKKDPQLLNEAKEQFIKEFIKINVIIIGFLILLILIAYAYAGFEILNNCEPIYHYYSNQTVDKVITGYTCRF